jgi:predicted transcriptional regulator
MTEESPAVIDMTADIVSAYVGANTLAPSDLPGFIRQVHSALAELARGEAAAPPAEPLRPAVSIRRSITPDHLISLEDGRAYKLLKRHLATLGLTPQAYREKWGLPKDYPMIAPTYAAARSMLAKTLGLGRRAGAPAAAARATKTKGIIQPKTTVAPAAKTRAKAGSADGGATKAASTKLPTKQRGRAKKPA